jgi:hypothetical protein
MRTRRAPRDLRRALGLMLLAAAPSASCARAADDATNAARAEPAALSAEPASAHCALTRRVLAIGASATAGFGTRADLARAFQACLPERSEFSSGLGSPWFFLRPLSAGSEQVQSALAAEPTLVLALDFLFWFGYGALDAQGAPLANEDDRLALLERGLALLEPVRCPLVLGDFPDMSAAVGKMLLPVQMPELATLARLNTRLSAWAAERPHVRIVPLAELLGALARGEELRIGALEYGADEAAALLQRDRLHPTREGLLALALLALESLRELPGFEACASERLELATLRTRFEELAPETAKRRARAAMSGG